MSGTGGTGEFGRVERVERVDWGREGFYLSQPLAAPSGFASLRQPDRFATGAFREIKSPLRNSAPLGCGQKEASLWPNSLLSVAKRSPPLHKGGFWRHFKFIMASI